MQEMFDSNYPKNFIINSLNTSFLLIEGDKGTTVPMEINKNFVNLNKEISKNNFKHIIINGAKHMELGYPNGIKYCAVWNEIKWMIQNNIE